MARKGKNIGDSTNSDADTEGLRLSTLSASQQLERAEPRRCELLAQYEQMFPKRRFEHFRQYVSTEHRTWRNSPTALLLVGCSYYHEQNWESALALVDEAEGIWVDLGQIGMITPHTIEQVQSNIARCRAQIFFGRGDESKAQRILDEHIKKVKASKELGAEERRRIVHSLEHPSDLGAHPMPDFILI